MDWQAVSAELQKKLDPKHIKSSPNVQGDYLEGWHVIDEANTVFGFGNWSYTITGLTKDSCIEVEKNGRMQWQAAYTCIVRVTVGEVVREDVGFGSGFANNIGAAIEGATKEAVTDALKRCLRTFGSRFGLALYDKSRANVGREMPHEVMDAIRGAETMESLQAVWMANREWHTNPDFLKAKDDKKAELLEREAA